MNFSVVAHPASSAGREILKWNQPRRIANHWSDCGPSLCFAVLFRRRAFMSMVCSPFGPLWLLQFCLPCQHGIKNKWRAHWDFSASQLLYPLCGFLTGKKDWELKESPSQGIYCVATAFCWYSSLCLPFPLLLTALVHSLCTAMCGLLTPLLTVAC